MPPFQIRAGTWSLTKRSRGKRGEIVWYFRDLHPRFTKPRFKSHRFASPGRRLRFIRLTWTSSVWYKPRIYNGATPDQEKFMTPPQRPLYELCLAWLLQHAIFTTYLCLISFTWFIYFHLVLYFHICLSGFNVVFVTMGWLQMVYNAMNLCMHFLLDCYLYGRASSLRLNLCHSVPVKIQPSKGPPSPMSLVFVLWYSLDSNFRSRYESWSLYK